MAADLDFIIDRHTGGRDNEPARSVIAVHAPPRIVAQDEADDFLTLLNEQVLNNQDVTLVIDCSTTDRISNRAVWALTNAKLAGYTRNVKMQLCNVCAEVAAVLRNFGVGKTIPWTIAVPAPTPPPSSPASREAGAS